MPQLQTPCPYFIIYKINKFLQVKNSFAINEIVSPFEWLFSLLFRSMPTASTSGMRKVGKGVEVRAQYPNYPSMYLR